MPFPLHSSKSNCRPDLSIITQKYYRGGVCGRDECGHATCFVQLPGHFVKTRKRSPCGQDAHGEALHSYTSGMDLHLLKEGGVSYTKVPLVCYVKAQPNWITCGILKSYTTVNKIFCKSQAKAGQLTRRSLCGEWPCLRNQRALKP